MLEQWKAESNRGVHGIVLGIRTSERGVSESSSGEEELEGSGGSGWWCGVGLGVEVRLVVRLVVDVNVGMGVGEAEDVVKLEESFVVVEDEAANICEGGDNCDGADSEVDARPPALEAGSSESINSRFPAAASSLRVACWPCWYLSSACNCEFSGEARRADEAGVSADNRGAAAD